MKIKIFIDSDHEEEVLIYAHSRTKLVDEIEELIENDSTGLVGYRESEIKRIDPKSAVCFFVEDNKVYAMLEKEKWNLKQRLYALEGMLGGDFVKINQSCIANVRMIEKFDVSFGGGLLVIFKNGHRDYVSRRQMKAVKEKIGI